MMTFSINTGTVTESISSQLTSDFGNQSAFNSLLVKIPDNETGFINPPDIRNLLLSTWSSTIFKLTTSTESNIPYVAIDTLNPDNNDLKERKILLGKKEYKSNEIVSDDLINTDYDIFFYNTKQDTQQQLTTRLSLLSGVTNFQNSPFIQSQTIFRTVSAGAFNQFQFSNSFLISFDTNTNTYQSFDFNSNGNFNLSSSNIIINDFKLPNSASASNEKIISWNEQDNTMVYSNLTSQLPSTVGTQSEPLDIFGNPTNINGFEIGFSDIRRCPIEIGDIRLGGTFSGFSISEILKRLIYQYLPPSSNIKILPPHENGYVEFGLIPQISLEFSILKRTFNTNIATLLNMIPGTYPAIISQDYSSITATASGLITSPLNTNGVNFSVTVGDGTQSTISSTNIRGIYPYYHGFSTQAIINSSGLSQLNKMIEDKSNKDIVIQPGSGFFYFIYDSLYGDLVEILNQNDNDIIITSFIFTQTLSSSEGLWVNKEFKVYRINNLSTTVPIIYKFKY